MTNEGSRRGRDATPSRSGTPGRAPDPDRPTLPGWRISRPGRPATGSGQPPGQKPSGPNGRWVVFLIVLGLLALNLYISYEFQQPASRVQIPYSPTFLQEVNAGNVSQISSTGDSIQGTFRAAVKYPKASRSAQPKIKAGPCRSTIPQSCFP